MLALDAVSSLSCGVVGLIAIQLEGYAEPCPEGFHYSVKAVDREAETVTIYRDECAGVPHYATVPISALRLAHKVVGGTYYDLLVPDAVVQVLEQVRHCGWRVRVSKGYTEAYPPRNSTKAIGEDWLEEFDVEGTIGRSMGPVKASLLINNSRSLGGGSISADSIVKIRLTGKGGRVLWQHPLYRLPKLEKREIPASEQAEKKLNGLTWEVLADGEVHARFKTAAQADRCIAKF